MSTRVVGIYPLEGTETEPPVRQIIYGEGTMIVVNLSDEELATHLEELASIIMEQRADGIYEANIQLSVWRNSGQASALEKQLLFNVRIKEPTSGERFYVVDPWCGHLCDMQMLNLLHLAEQDNGLLGVAKALGGNLLANEFELNRQQFPQGPVGAYNGYREISPQKFPIGLSKCADVKVGLLEYTVLLCP